MKTLVATNQKGGVGKTAIIVSLAWDFALRQKKVAIIDLDVQGNCSFTLDSQIHAEKASDILLGKTVRIKVAENNVVLFPYDTKLQMVEQQDLRTIAQNLRSGLEQLREAGYDVCLIDSPAAFGVRFMAGLLATDYVLAPIELEVYSMQGIKQLLATFGNAKKMHPKLKFIGMVANKVDKRNPRHRENLVYLQKAYPDLLLPVTIGLRTSIAESLVSGKPTWENKKTAARIATKEIRAMANIVFERMEI